MTEAARKFLDGLTPRLREVYFEITTSSDSLSGIADRLGIKVDTLKTHAGRLYERAGCDGRQHLTLWSIANGAVPCPCGKNHDG